jgi:hypothetical protein
MNHNSIFIIYSNQELYELLKNLNSTKLSQLILFQLYIFNKNLNLTAPIY